MAFRLANGLMLALFLLATVVQYNDPDPAPWMAMYGAATLVCVLAYTGRLKWPLPALVGVAAAIWAGWWIPRWWGKTTFTDTFGHMGMVDVAAEEARETLGLALVALWMAVIAVRARGTGSRVRQA